MASNGADLLDTPVDPGGIIPVPQDFPVIDADVKTKKAPPRKVGLQRKLLKLSDDQKKKVKQYLSSAWDEWTANTSLLHSKLRRSNDLIEGIKTPKDFPWRNSANIHIPLIEIHLTILHSVASSTMLEMEPMYMIKQLLPGGEEVDLNIELFLHWVCKIQLKLDEVISDIFWTTYSDGTGIGDLDWVAEYRRRYDSKVFMSIEEFTAAYPTAKSAGVTQNEYDDYIHELLTNTEEGLELEIEETVPEYVGPKLRIVLLKDFVVIPTPSPTLDYAQFIGDVYVQRADYFRRKSRDKFMDDTEMELMLKQTGLTSSPDSIMQAQNRIEGLGSNRTTPADEYRIMQGILKMDLFDKGCEEQFIIQYHKDSNALIWIEKYPYWHNRSKYIIWRFKKRPNRLLGQSLYDQLIDLNEEVDTQHEQRIDSRTITTVPSFKKLNTSDFDPTRKDQRFYPGVTFKVTNMQEVQQFEIKQTDMTESMGEEQNLFMIADMRTGASQLRSGREISKDPRASGKKTALLLQQSNNRIDDHMRELKLGNIELAAQILDLYYQYAPDAMIQFAANSYDQDTGEVAAQTQKEIQRVKLRNNNMRIDVTRTSVLDNPDQMAQRSMVLHQLLINEPLIGQNLLRRRESLRRLLRSMRERNIEKLLPTLQQYAVEMMQQAQMGNPNSPMMQNLLATISQTGQTDAGKPEGTGSQPARSEISPRTVNPS
jgi:hypothetical protein